MSLKIHFPEDIEGFVAALDGISEATAQAAQDGSESLRAFRRGVQVALAAMIKATGGQGQPMDPIKLMEPIDRVNPLNRVTNRLTNRLTNRVTTCPLKGIYADESNGYYCRFYRERCPLLENPAYNYLTCPGWHEYENNRCHIYA